MISLISNTSSALAKSILLIVLFTFVPSLLSAGPTQRDIAFFKISIEEGLSQSTVFDIAQDNMGNLWVATADGLNKYDGYRFTVYRSDSEDEEAIQSDYLRALCMVEGERILIGGKSGVTLYDIRKNRFTNHLLNKEIHQIISYNESIYYMICLSDIYKYNVETGNLSLEYEAKDLNLHTIKLYNNQLLLGTSKGLYYFKDGNLEPYPVVVDALVQDIKQVNNGFWLATEGKGLLFLHNNGGIKSYMPVKGNDKSLISPNVRKLEIDAQGRLWVGTMDGLSIYNQETDDFACYNSSSIKEGKISHNSIRSMCLDNQGGMWLGTYFGGLNYYHPLQNQFKNISNIPFTNSLSDDIISCIVEGKPGELWIGTNDEGLNRYDTQTGEFTYYSKENCLLSNNIKAVLVDGDYIYVGSHGGGMSRVHIKTRQARHYTKENSKLGSNDVYSILKDKKGNLWIATLDGLKILDPSAEIFYTISDYKPIGVSTDNLAALLSSRQVHALYQDSKDKIWIGTELGVYTFSLNNNLLVHYDIGSTKKYERINCFLESYDKRIWIGMHSGLGVLDDATQTIRTFNTHNGLPNNNVYGILEDGNNRLWISTNNGLACITPGFERIRYYTLKDGIQGDQFNYYAYCRLQSGEMYFGGVNGITHFFPEHLIDNPYIPQAVISDLKVYNTTVLPDDGTGIVEQDISYTQSITLRPTQNSFSLQFTVPNFLSMKHDMFAYRLEGVDGNWIYTSDNQPVVYSNLNPGHYVFQVKAGNRDARWSEEVRELNIRVLPFWWDTLWFKAGLLLSTILVLYLLIRVYNNRQKLKNELALERLEQEKKEEINQTKLRFFINISHEFRTPLTLILSPLKELINHSTDKWAKNQMEIVMRNANKLMHLVDQLMDYRKADLGVFALKVLEGDVSKQVDEQMELFDRLARQKDIDFVYENSLSREKVWYDPAYFDLIVSNLLSNAFKFTPQHGSITIKTYLRDENFVFSISDTGTGMKEEDRARAFERFFQANNEVKGTGVGLSLVKRLVELHHAQIELQSAIGQGTTVIVSIPQDINIYPEQERAEAKEDLGFYRQMSDEKIDLLVQPGEYANRADDETGEEAKKPTILIVEDDPDVRSYLINNFQDVARVEKATNGKEALEVINEKEVDLMITDLMMPVMDGMVLTKTIKQNIKTSHIPVIMLTAKSGEEDKYEGFVAGADSYIQKPFDISILKVRVRNMLQSKYRILQHYSDTLEIEPQKLALNELDREFLEKAKSIVEKNMDNVDFSVDDFCRDMAMSRSNLHLKMKAITGESTVEFIKKIRFNEACNLLKDGRYSVTEISTMVGFSASSYFTTSFKKYFGMLPTEYVRKLKE
ncbi:two-component regulator propeller domain-containing protein [Bacteroides sp. 51]|uniref:hybrid sensor histidine kinase/response regulator transcription factor n=1 Tax=Bacteroides sp. 51 TaxID=2302938 RepID=UPI0013D59873|nr:two-component regulator propeller domain-containing protein [Bacteroides sp. 51]NDV82122.1 response regulator [Bacteroides sp. 51]